MESGHTPKSLLQQYLNDAKKKCDNTIQELQNFQQEKLNQIDIDDYNEQLILKSRNALFEVNALIRSIETLFKAMNVGKDISNDEEDYDDEDVKPVKSNKKTKRGKKLIDDEEFVKEEKVEEEKEPDPLDKYKESDFDMRKKPN